MVAARRRVVGLDWALVLVLEQLLAAVSDGVASLLVAGLIAQLVRVLASPVVLAAVLAADVVPVSGESSSVGMGGVEGAAALGLLDEV